MEKTMKIICLGDSITGQANLERYIKWSFILECMCEAAYGPGKIEVLNRGIGGDTTAGVLARLDKDVLVEQPDITIVLLGGNDVDRQVPRDQVKSNLELIATRIMACGSKVLLLQYHVLPNPENPETAWIHLDKNNDLIAEVAGEYKIPVLSLAEPMREALNRYDHNELVNATDGVHLNSAGEIVFAKTIFKCLNKLNWLAE